MRPVLPAALSTQRSSLPLALLLLLVGLSVTALRPAPARAADIPVTTTTDTGAGSPREAIVLANASPDADRITFAVAGTITLAAPLPTIAGTLTIEGPGAGSFDIDGGGTITDLGGNITADASCPVTTTSSRNSTDPVLGPLRDNGGPTQAMALQDGSPAIDAVVAPCLLTDQRGVTRPQGPRCGSGAFQLDAAPPEGSFTVTLGATEIAAGAPLPMTVTARTADGTTATASHPPAGHPSPQRQQRFVSTALQPPSERSSGYLVCCTLGNQRSMRP